MNKDQFEDLLLNYCYAIYDDMTEQEARSFIIQILCNDKRYLRSDQLLDEVREKYPELIAEK